MKIQTRIQLLTLAAVIAILLVGSFGLIGTHVTFQSLESVYQNRVVSLRMLKRVSEAYSNQVGSALTRMNNGELTTAEGLQIIYEARDTIQCNWRLYQTKNLSADERRMVNDMQPIMEVADQEIEGVVRAIEILQEQGNGMLANRLGMILTSVDPVVRPVSERLDALSNMQLDLARHEYENADARFKRNFAISAVILLLCLVGAVVNAQRLHRQIIVQLRAILDVVEQVGSGALNQQIPYPSTDELGVIAHSINSMIQALRSLVGNVTHCAPQVASSAAELLKVSEQVIHDSKRYAGHSSSAAQVTALMAQTLHGHGNSLANMEQSMELRLMQLEGPDYLNPPPQLAVFKRIHASSREASRELMDCAHHLHRIARATQLAKVSAMRSAQELEKIQRRAVELNQVAKTFETMARGFRL